MAASQGRWTKHYRRDAAGAAACRDAATHHAWLTSLGAPVPALLTVHNHSLDFEHITGAHARPHDLPALAHLLGVMHRRAYQHGLHHARLDRPYRTDTGDVLPDFTSGRCSAVVHLLEQRAVPEPALPLPRALTALEAGLDGPACFYKDSNPRNFLIAPDRPVLVDFDTLTLAPTGYDLAKLIVTLVMTHGPLPALTMRQALTTYNTALTHPLSDALPPLPAVPWNTLMTWADLHHILTSPYIGHGGYRHHWPGAPN